MNLLDYRQKVITKLSTVLSEEKAIEVESGIIKYTKECYKNIVSWENINVRRKYIRKSLSLIFNLKENEKLKYKIETSEVSVHDFIRMKPDELIPEKWEHIKMKKYLKDNTKINYEGLFKCERCKGKNTSYYQLQTRSADEPMTTYIQCLNCNFTWSDST